MAVLGIFQGHLKSHKLAVATRRGTYGGSRRNIAFCSCQYAMHDHSRSLETLQLDTSTKPFVIIANCNPKPSR